MLDLEPAKAKGKKKKKKTKGKELYVSKGFSFDSAG